MNKRIVTIPNIISCIRLVLVPFIAMAYLGGHTVLGIVLLALSGLSDMLDGFIARRFNAISDLGKLLDPLADKLTAAAVVLCLTLHHPWLTGLLVVLVIKELVLGLGALHLYHTGSRPSESKLWGKLATTFLYTLMILLFFSDCFDGGLLPDPVFWVLAALAGVCMVLALIQYTRIFFAIRKGLYDVETESFQSASSAAENAAAPTDLPTDPADPAD